MPNKSRTPTVQVLKSLESVISVLQERIKQQHLHSDRASVMRLSPLMQDPSIEKPVEQLHAPNVQAPPVIVHLLNFMLTVMHLNPVKAMPVLEKIKSVLDPAVADRIKDVQICFESFIASIGDQELVESQVDYCGYDLDQDYLNQCREEAVELNKVLQEAADLDEANEKEEEKKNKSLGDDSPDCDM